MKRVARTQLCAYDHSLVSDQLLGYAVGWSVMHSPVLVHMREVFYISLLWLSSALHGWTASESQA